LIHLTKKPDNDEEDDSGGDDDDDDNNDNDGDNGNMETHHPTVMFSNSSDYNIHNNNRVSGSCSDDNKNNEGQSKKIINDSKAVMQTIANQMASTGKSFDEFDDNLMGQSTAPINNSSSSNANTRQHGNETDDGGDENEEINDMVLLQEAKPKELPSLKTKVQDKVASINNTIDIVKKTQATRKSIRMASVAGTLAGGVVGLAVAGPAGAFVGSKIGQIAAGVGVLIEGTVSVGVLVAGVKGTMFTVNQLQGMSGGKGDNKNRLLTIGEKGTECKLVLVRPNVIVDPEWEKITLEARRTAPRDEGKGGIVSNFFATNEVIAKKGRQKRDAAIANSEDHEIPLKEKIFLLVSSSLNDKKSLPGYVYRKLIEKLRERVEERQSNSKEETVTDDLVEDRHVRQDVHAIIKHITATLLEVRPGFSSSQRITEISASAVESLVFGEVYDLVFDEIVSETREKDKSLGDRILNAQCNSSSAEFISEEAIHALRILPEQHSVSEKLSCCVKILESISNVGEAQNMSADSLLKMVCQHIVIANVKSLNAECLFLEEFARDEQLLRGREGYALVTMQASLHYLNVSSNLMDDVFCED